MTTETKKKEVDPFTRLRQYYVQNHPSIDNEQISKSNNFKDYSQQSQILKTIVWRSEFHCPVTKQIHYCAEHESVKEEFSDGHFYFTSKKIAQRSATLVAMKSMGLIEDSSAAAAVSPPPPSSPTVENHVFLEKYTNEKESITDDKMNEKKASAAPRSEPKWIHSLRKLGLKPTEVKISFESKHERRWSHSTFPHYKPLLTHSTLLQCRIHVVKENFKVTTISELCKTKNQARSSAIQLLKLEMERQKVQLNDNEQQLSKTQWIPHKFITHPFIDPSFFKSSFDPKTPFYYLYQIETKALNTTKYSSPQVHLIRNILHNETCDPIGILFSSSEPLPIEVNQEISVEFPLVLPNSNFKEKMMLQLTLKRGTQISSQKILYYKKNILKYNRILKYWKSYGFAFIEGGRAGGRNLLTTNSTYHHFVPISISKDNSTLSIDWEKLTLVCSGEMTKYLTHLDVNWPFIPWIGQLSCLLISQTCFLFSIFFLAVPFSQWTLIDATLSLLSLFTSLIFLYLHYRKPNHLSHMELINSFILQTRKPTSSPLLYTYAINSNETVYPPNATAQFLTPAAKATISETKIQFVQNKFNYNLLTATFETYVRHRYGIQIRFLKEELLPAFQLTKHSDFDWWTVNYDSTTTNKQGSSVSYKLQSCFIIPELVYLLPLKRNVVYITSKKDLYLPLLEKQLNIMHLFSSLKLLSDHVQSRMPPPPSSSTTKIKHDTTGSILHHNRTVASLLIEAVSIFPCVSYQRLEFLGDPVFDFFLSILLFSYNSSLKYNIDDLEDAKSLSLKNTVLQECATKIALDTIIIRKKSTNDPIPDRCLSDITESLLAATFLIDEYMSIGLLDLLNLPLFLEQEEDDEKYNTLPTKKYGKFMLTPWFTPHQSCLTAGYAFNLDKKWLSQIVSVGATIMSNDIMDRLQNGYHLFLNMFMSSQDDQHEIIPSSVKECNKILLMTALFDDSLGYKSTTDGDDDSYFGDSFRSSLGGTRHRSSIYSFANNIEDNNDDLNEDDRSYTEFLNETTTEISVQFSPQAEEKASLPTNFSTRLAEFEQIALLRDTLFLIGNSSLHLCISKALYLKYPDATAGDMHMLKTMTISDDAITYVMIKNHIHECLYDYSSSSSSSAFQELIAQISLADTAGEELWKQKGSKGWLASDGVEEYRKRRTHFSIPPSLNEPRYVGLAGGRFCHHAHSKLSSELTGDFTFSFKAIIGALVLSIGLNDTFTYFIGPLVEELYLLNPNEARHAFGDISTICQNYQKGYESSLVNVMR